ncbi:MAG TPA: PorT family protein, partial [Cyclobacteriaceae bacterium]|nr:PorT family protein [Cyclobacteriaceae bacterium]
NNLQLEAGMGFDFYFPLFKFSQEIRFARGIVNMLGTDQSIYSDPIQRLNSNTIAVYFIFQ